MACVYPTIHAVIKATVNYKPRTCFLWDGYNPKNNTTAIAHDDRGVFVILNIPNRCTGPWLRQCFNHGSDLSEVTRMLMGVIIAPRG